MPLPLKQQWASIGWEMREDVITLIVPCITGDLTTSAIHQQRILRKELMKQSATFGEDSQND